MSSIEPLDGHPETYDCFHSDRSSWLRASPFTFDEKMMRLLISGGPGSGCTSTAAAIGERLGVPVFDSDSYFHKPTNPPFQEQYTPEERRKLLGAVLNAESSWILSGSIATWDLESLCPTHGVFLDISRGVRHERLMNRQRARFGSRIDAGKDLHEEHESFLRWAAEYDDRRGSGRNSTTDRAFLETHCQHFFALTDIEPIDGIVSRILGFLSHTTKAERGGDDHTAAPHASPWSG